MLPRLLLFSLLALSARATAQTAPQSTVSQEEEQEDDVPRRAERNFGITLESGWKNYAGMAGVGLTWHVRPRLSLQLGGGAGFLLQPRVGTRIRWNLFDTAVTPFLGGGFIFDAGGPTGGGRDSEDAPLVSYQVTPSLSTQLVVGLEWVTGFGLTFRADVGYTQLLTNNLKVDGELPTRTADEARLWFQSGPSAGLAVGWTF